MGDDKRGAIKAFRSRVVRVHDAANDGHPVDPGACKVAGIVGGMCSGETIASLEKVAVPNGVVMIAPSATSPALTSVDDQGLFFRTAPSDARQGEVMADIITERGIKNVAVTYTNNDYGKGLADSFANSYKEKGGSVTMVAAHDDGKADYSAEVAALAAAGGDALVVAGYVDQGGSGIVRGALDTGAFSTFVLPDGMVNTTLADKFGTQLETSFGQNCAAQPENLARFPRFVTVNKVPPSCSRKATWRVHRAD